MKKIICSSVFFLILFFFGCTHYLEDNGSFTPPTLKSEPRLFYPKAALENSFSGTPRVILYITKEGKVDKASIIKSSGIGVLDSAAVEYCRNFIFNPAEINGKPINARMALDLKFQFSNQNWDAGNYVRDVNDLYDQLATADSEEKEDIEAEIFKKHNEFTGKMKDIVNYNNYIGMVILPVIYSEWKNDWDSWPLSFMLYHDFIQRFPDYKNIEAVKKELRNSLLNDIQYIKITPVKSRVSQIEKEILLSKIKKLVENKYPEMINDIGLEIKNDTLSVL